MTLAILPDRNIPELDEALARRLERSEPVDKLIVRYASGSIVRRVEQEYARRPQLRRACFPPLVFYFLKWDPAYGEREMRAILSKPPVNGVCWDVSWSTRDLGQYLMSPALERLGIEYLSSPVVVIKQGFAKVLGEYGSAAAEQPLWNTMIDFHNWWHGHESEFVGQPGHEARYFEPVLASALAQANAWVLNETDLLRLRNLCIGASCRAVVDECRGKAKPPIEIVAGERIGQYRVESIEEMRRKLAQYPRGTHFRLMPGSRAQGDRETHEAIQAAEMVLEP